MLNTVLTGLHFLTSYISGLDKVFQKSDFLGGNLLGRIIKG